MKNEPDLSSLWPEVCARGAAALQPNLASRVLARMAEARDDLTPRTTFLLGFSTAAACLVLTLAISLWRERTSSIAALAQWSTLATETAALEQEVPL